MTISSVARYRHFSQNRKSLSAFPQCEKRPFGLKEFFPFSRERRKSSSVKSVMGAKSFCICWMQSVLRILIVIRKFDRIVWGFDL